MSANKQAANQSRPKLPEGARLQFQERMRSGSFANIQFGKDRSANKALAQQLFANQALAVAVFAPQSVAEDAAKYFDYMIEEKLGLANAKVTRTSVKGGDVRIAVAYGIDDNDVEEIF